jgi:hypothetical protein
MRGSLITVAADKRIHAKKKWRLGKGLLFIVRQDIPQWNWARVPSPELQLEHEVCTAMPCHILVRIQCSNGFATQTDKQEARVVAK